MIKTELVTIGNREFKHTYSDAGRYVVRDGVEYAEAYDPSSFNYIYTEGDPIEGEDSTEDILSILMGGDL